MRRLIALAMIAGCATTSSTVATSEGPQPDPPREQPGRGEIVRGMKRVEPGVAACREG